MGYVTTTPTIFKWSKIVDNKNLTSASDLESEEFAIRLFTGNTVLWLDFSTVTTAGDISITIELYNVKSGKWGKYNGGNTLETISSSNVTTDKGIYLKLTDYDAWAWADKAKITLSTTAADVVLDVYVGGQ